MWDVEGASGVCARGHDVRGRAVVRGSLIGSCRWVVCEVLGGGGDGCWGWLTGGCLGGSLLSRGSVDTGAWRGWCVVWVRCFWCGGEVVVVDLGAWRDGVRGVGGGWELGGGGEGALTTHGPCLCGRSDIHCAGQARVAHLGACPTDTAGPSTEPRRRHSPHSTP